MQGHIPVKKLVIGFPMYTTTYDLLDSAKHSVGSPARKTPAQGVKNSPKQVSYNQASAHYITKNLNKLTE